LQALRTVQIMRANTGDLDAPRWLGLSVVPDEGSTAFAALC